MKVKHFEVQIEVKEGKKFEWKKRKKRFCGTEEDNDRRCICERREKALKSGMLQTVCVRLLVKLVWR